MSEQRAQVDELAVAAVAPIKSGMVVGVGTGRAASRGIGAMMDRIRSEKLDIKCVATSEETEQFLGDHGVEVIDFANIERIDYLFDGADEVDHKIRITKGSRGAFTRERMIAHVAERCVFMIGQEKLVDHLGQTLPLAIAVMAFGLTSIRAQLRKIGLNGVVRRDMDGHFHVTDNGNLVLDVTLDDQDVDELATTLNDMPGVVDHGLFITEADEVLVETDHGLERLVRPIED